MQRSSDSAARTTNDRAGDSLNNSLVRGLVAGMLPLALVAAVVGLFLLVEVLVGHLTVGQDFFMAQRVAVIVLIVGMVAAVVTYAVSCRRALQRVGAWQRAGFRARAAATVVGLAVTVIVVLLPILLAVFVPQHPAP